MAMASRVTVPFEARDLISGAVRGMRQMIQRATDDVREFRRIAGTMGDDLVSSSRRAQDAADDLGRRIQGAADDVRDFNRIRVDDIFRRSRAGADDLLRSASRADSEIRGISDAHVRLRATDEISPLVDGISAKISSLAAVAGGIVLGSGASDAMFGGVSDYYKEAARLAPYLSAQQRSEVLATNDQLVAQGLISDRATGASELSTLVPMVKDKSKVAEAFSATTKLQAVIPDSGAEETQRAVTQTAKSFKESYSKAADSIAYSYAAVGDPQKDLLDTFWEYSPYFSSAGTSSAQMSNFLSKTVQEGAFNFDKPGDFFKEVFGVKALNAGDMESYFGHRGAGKEEAKRQAAAFTTDINSGNQQQAQGAIAALVADLASQSRSELKESLVLLGSGAGEDNADSILKTFGVAFEKAPDMTGTTDRLVSQQQAADPLIEFNQTRAQLQMQMQDIGGNIMQASLPALKEFNTLITENKDSIEAFGVGVANAITKVTSIYQDNAGLINGALIGLASVLVVKGLVSFAQGVKQLNSDLAGAAGWVGQKGKSIVTATGQGLKNGWDRLRGKTSNPDPTEETPAQRSERIRNRMGGRGIRRDFDRNRGSRDDLGGGLRGASSMTINARNVYVNGSVSGGGGNRGDRRNGRNGRRGGGRNGGPSGDRNRNNPPDNPNPNRRGSRDNPYRVPRPTPPTPPEPDVPNGGKLGNFLKSNAKMLKAGGIVGAATSLGFGAYELYETAKETGWKEAISTSGGSVAGGAIGGTLGGIVGSLAGPLGTAAGAWIGNWAGEKLGSLADSSGLTRGVVDAVSNLTDSVKGWFGFGPKEEPQRIPAMPELPKESFITTTSSTTKEGEQKIKETMESVVSNVQKSGLKQGLKDAMDESGVTQAANKIKNKLVEMFRGTDSKDAENNVKAVGTAAKESEKQAKDLGVSSKNAAQDIVSGNGQAALSFSGVSSSAKSAIDLTRQHLESLSTVSSKGSTWGSNLISMMAAGMQSKFPTLTSIVSKAAGVIKNYLGFSSPTKEGPASKSDKWAPNFMTMFNDGLRPDSVKQSMSLIAGTMRDGVDGIEGPSLSGGNFPIRTIPLAAQASTGAKSVTIGNIQMDFGSLAADITDFQSFAKALTSPEGRALIRDVFGEELYKALETGG